MRENLMFNDIRTYLSNEFWVGKRWVAGKVDLLKSGIRPRCFHSCFDANFFCEQMYSKGEVYGYYLLPTVLRRLNEVPDQSVSSLTRLTLLNEIISRLPINIWGERSIAIDEWLKGRYWPVYWRTSINPLIDIHSFRILRPIYNNGRFKCVGVFPEWQEALSSFYRLAAERFSNPLFLAGSDDVNEMIVFYRLSQDSPGEIVQVNDPCTVIPVNQAMFARIEFSRRQIQYYDGYLRRIQPGIPMQELDFKWFAHYKD